MSTVDGQGSVLLSFLPTPPPIISSSLPGASTTNLTIGWSAVAGVTYQMQSTTNLAQPNWLPIGSLTATGTNANLPDNSTPQPQQFYRVIIP